MKKFLKKIVFFLLIIVVVSCSDDDDTSFVPVEPSIADILAASPDYSSLLAAVIKAELVTTLDGEGTFTVFAPDNDAFTEFLKGKTLKDFSKGELASLLLNHVLGTERDAASLQTGYEKNLSTSAIKGQNLSVYINKGDNVKINNIATVRSNVGQFDINASNGIIHRVDKVIPIPTMLTFVTADPDLSTLAATATKTEGFITDFAKVLISADSNLTLLAPDNAAFEAMDLTKLDVTTVEQVLLNHVLNGIQVSDSLTTSYTNTSAIYEDTENNLSLYINTESGVTFNGISNVTTADILASNGVIHKVGAVNTLPTVVTFASADATFSTLVAALTRDADFTFVKTLSTTGVAPAPFTVFAPTNEAFGKLLIELEAPDLASIPSATLAAALSYHVVTEANLRSNTLANNQEISTLETGKLIVNITDGATVTDENTRVTNLIATDVQAVNGVIHVVDQVLLPAAK